MRRKPSDSETISSQVMHSNPGDGSYKPILSCQPGSNNNNCQFDFQVNAHGKVNFFFNAGGSFKIVSSTNGIAANQWVKLKVQMTGNTAVLFVDGAQVSSVAYSGSKVQASASSPITIGKFNNGQDQTWTGEIRSVKLESSVGNFEAFGKLSWQLPS